MEEKREPRWLAAEIGNQHLSGRARAEQRFGEIALGDRRFTGQRLLVLSELQNERSNERNILARRGNDSEIGGGRGLHRGIIRLAEWTVNAIFVRGMSTTLAAAEGE